MSGIQIFQQKPSVSRTEKEESLRQKGVVYWLTGLSGSGKSTIAYQFERRLFSIGLSTIVLDGDNVRSGLCNGLGFSPEDRKENLRRVAEVCRMNAESGIVVIASFISPLESDRAMVREIIGSDYNEVFINTPLEVCESRDVKGLYKKARLGEIPNFTGISSPYESPKNPEIVLDGHKKSIDESCQELISHYSSLVSQSGLKRVISISNDWSSVNHGNSRMNLTENQHAVFIGRFQPLHDGHVSLFRQKLELGIHLLILVRDLAPDRNNPFTADQTIHMIKSVFEGQSVAAMKIPDIESVNWGRGVGYELNEYFPPESLASVSATQIRNSINDGNQEWRKHIDPRIHDYILQSMKLSKMA